MKRNGLWQFWVLKKGGEWKKVKGFEAYFDLVGYARKFYGNPEKYVWTYQWEEGA